MKHIELRRHSKRLKPSKHLSQEGVDLARKIGESMGPYFRVFSSNAPRAMETAVAMGFAIDEIRDEISMTPSSIEDEVEWGMNFAKYAHVIRKGKKTAAYAEEMSRFLLELIKNFPDSSSTLILSHGGLIELVTIGCFPESDFSQWGDALNECEGVLLTIKDEKFIDMKKIQID